MCEAGALVSRSDEEATVREQRLARVEDIGLCAFGVSLAFLVLLQPPLDLVERRFGPGGCPSIAGVHPVGDDAQLTLHPVDVGGILIPAVQNCADHTLV